MLVLVPPEQLIRTATHGVLGFMSLTVQENLDVGLASVRRLGVNDTAVLLVGFQPDGLNILGHARLDPTLSRVKWYGSKDAFSPVMYPPHAPVVIGMWSSGTGELVLYNE